MMSNNSNDLGTFLAGFIIGGLVGAAAALLTAPQSGEETRVLIRDKSIELKDMAVESGQEARVRAEKALDDARVRADTALADLQTRTDELARVTKERAADLQKQISTSPGSVEAEAEVEVDITEDVGGDEEPAAA